MKVYDMGSISEIINLTPHNVTLHMWESDPMTLPSEGNVRVEEKKTPLHFFLGGLQVDMVSYGEVTGLPPRRAGVLHLVSRMVLEAIPDRGDLVSPGDLVRDAQGRIIACQSLIARGPLTMVGA